MARIAVLATLSAFMLFAGSASAHTAPCSAGHLSAKLPAQKLPAKVASVRARIARAAVACDYAALQRIADEKNGFTYSFGAERSAAAYWRAQERRGDKPLFKLVRILSLPVTRNEAGAYAWPSAYTTHPTAKDWNAVVRAGVLTRKQADQMRRAGNVYYGYRVAITKSGDWQFFVAGD